MNLLEWITLSYPAAGLVFALVYITLLRQHHLRLAGGLLVVLAAWGGVVANYTVIHFGGGFGPGTLLFCAMIPAFALALIGFIAGRAHSFRLFGDDSVRRRWYWLGMVIIPGLMFAPMIGKFTIGDACDARNHDGALPIIVAVMAYHRDNGGVYPTDLDALIPDYLDALPEPPCSLDNTSQIASYQLETCRSGETLITIPSVTQDSIERYNFATGNWSGISFLDGSCNYLR